MEHINKIENSYKYVVENSKYVKINYKKADELIAKLDKNKITYWLDSNPYNILDMTTEEIINFLLIYHTIGDYCFWGNPKWTINTDIGELDGSFAIMYITLNYFKEHKELIMNKDEFKFLLKGNVEIPLLDDRYSNLYEMNKFLNKRSFYNLIKNKTTDKELFSYIIDNFKYFEDISIYDDKEIYFYKRAQLLTSDILHILEIKDNVKVNYSNLIGCADYKIPQVLYCYGVLEYSKDLANRVDNEIPIEKGSKEEIEIRAADLEVIDYIYNKLNKKYDRININDFIWLLSQNKSAMNKKYHRTLTNNY